MINFKGQIWLYSSPADMRKAINGLSMLVSNEMDLNPTSEEIFVFYNKAKDKIKVLWWSVNGFCLFYKRLEKQRFKIPLTINDNVNLDPRELRWLLDGLDLSKIKGHKKLKFKNFC